MPRKGPAALALERALRSMDVQPSDAAAVELARIYAAGIDKSLDMVPVLGRGYRETLETLGMTPKARVALSKGEAAAPVASPIDEIRARREQRQRGAK
jgi:hypothetical protein